jgi:hypothetical protein
MNLLAIITFQRKEAVVIYVSLIGLFGCWMMILFRDNPIPKSIPGHNNKLGIIIALPIKSKYADEKFVLSKELMML